MTTSVIIIVASSITLVVSLLNERPLVSVVIAGAGIGAGVVLLLSARQSRRD